MRYPITFTALLTFMVGCRGTDSVDVPDFDPQSIASKAMEMFDTDSDGSLAGDELDACPGVKAAIPLLDTDGNKQVSTDEIAARVQSWLDSSTGGLPASVSVLYKGKPLGDATVVFEPEPFLEGVISPAEGFTSMSGRTELDCESLPFGAQAGFYRVRITSEGTSIPAKYNEATGLGAEVSNESPGLLRGRFEFTLK